MAKILVTCGPIPSRMDSVKYITNKFKGGLAVKTAEELAINHNVTIIKWKFNNIKTTIRTIDVEDVIDYKNKVLDFKADMYILAAAVANLMPSNPWSGKFPSHDYKVGEKFDIKFEIAPRIIDEVKKKYPRSTLVGYKLYDGTDEKLIEAAWETLINSKANIIFANNPKWAKERKIMVTPDGSEINVTFDEHIKVINDLAKEKFYKTETIEVPWCIEPPISEELSKIEKIYPKSKKYGFTFGCFAYRFCNGFFTTSRGKKEATLSHVMKVDHRSRKIVSIHPKATLNAPLLDSIFKSNKHINVLLHGHKQCNGPTFPYRYPGTKSEADIGKLINFNKSPVFNINHHGYIAGFKTIDEAKKWIKNND